MGYGKGAGKHQGSWGEFYRDILFVVYTERGSALRIISARVAEPFERRIYNANSETLTGGWQRVNP